MQLCPWCSSDGPCQYRNGIECTSYICKRDKPNQNDPNDTFVEMFAKMFGYKEMEPLKFEVEDVKVQF